MTATDRQNDRLTERLGILLSEHGLTPGDLFERHGIPVTQVAREIESGSAAGEELLALLAKTFEVSPGWIRTGVHPPLPSGEPVTMIPGDPDGPEARAEFAKRFTDLSQKAGFTTGAKFVAHFRVSRGSWQKWHLGLGFPRPAQVKAFAEAFGVRPSFLRLGPACELTGPAAARRLPPEGFHAELPARTRIFLWRVTVLLADRGLTRGECAGMGGRSKAPLTALFGGRYAPEDVDWLAEVLRTSPEFLFTGRERGSEPAPPPAVPLETLAERIRPLLAGAEAEASSSSSAVDAIPGNPPVTPEGAAPAHPAADTGAEPAAAPGPDPSALLADPQGEAVHRAFTARMRRFLADSGLTREAFARHLGLKYVTLTAFLNERGLPQPARLVTMARALRIRPSVLLWGKAADLEDPRNPLARHATWRLRVLMADHGLTMQELGRRCGCTLDTVSLWFTAGALPRSPGKVAAALGTTVDFLFPAGVDRTTGAAGTDSAARTPVPPREAFRGRLKALLRARVIGVAELAPLLGVSGDVLWSWVTGRSLPSPEAMADLARVLGVDPEWLEGGSAEGGPRWLPPEPGPQAFGGRFSSLLRERGLTPETFANLARLNSATVRRWAAGKVLPRPDAARAAAAILGVTPAMLIHGVDTGAWECPVPVVLSEAAETWIREHRTRGPAPTAGLQPLCDETSGEKPGEVPGEVPGETLPGGAEPRPRGPVSDPAQTAQQAQPAQSAPERTPLSDEPAEDPDAAVLMIPEDPDDEEVRRGFTLRLQQGLAKTGLSLNEVARRTGISPGSLSRYRLGERVPPAGITKKLADLFGMRPSVLRFGPAAELTGPDAAAHLPRRTELPCSRTHDGAFFWRLRVLMTDRGLSANEFAPRCGCSPSPVFGWLARKSVPDERRLLRVAAALDTDTTFLLTGVTGVADSKEALALHARIDPAAFGRRLTAVTEALALESVELAAAIGVSENVMTTWRLGMTVPSPARVTALARELGVESRWLMTGERRDGAPSEPPAADPVSAGARLSDLLRLRGISNTEFGRLLGTNHGQVYCWLTGKHFMSTKRIRAAAEILGVTTALLVHGVELESWAEIDPASARTPVPGGAETSASPAAADSREVHEVDEVQEVPEAAGAAEANDAARPGGFPAWLADPGGSDPDPLTLIADPRSGAVLRAFVRRTSLARERLAASGRGAADADGMRFVSRTIALAESGCFPNPAGLVRLGRILGLRPSFLLWGPAAAAAAGGDALPEDIATAWRLRVLLADAGLNRSALQRPGVTYQDILHWLAGGRIPPAKARLIAEVLKTTPGYLVNGIPGEAAEDPVTNRSETFSPRIVPDAVHRAGLLLEERGLTPGDVDARLGLLPGLCALWLKGVLRPSGRRIGELAELLGTTRGQLLDGRAENTPATKRRRLRGPGATLPERQAAAAALRELMKVRGFSAPALARRLALPRRLVESWLRARKPVDPGCAAALAEALDVTPEELVGRGIIAALPDAARRPEASPVEPALEKKMRAVLARSADRLLELAAERSVPVTSLSHSLGIPYATILAWVRRTALPDTATIAKAAARFGVSVTRLLGDETDPSVIARLQSRPAPGTRVTRRRIRAASPDTGRDALRRAFAANFEALLAASPLSADGLAELLEIRPGRIREWLGGKSVPRAAQLRRLADALDTTPAALLDEGETAGEAGASPDTAGKFEAAAFRRRVDARLLDLGLTRTELSRRLGHPATWLTDLMRSPVVHRGADVTAVADALRTSPDWLLLGRGDAVRAPAEAPAGVPHGEHGEHESPGPGGKERAAINPHAVAARLRNLLKEHGLDAAGLSRDLGINYYTVRSWLLAVSIPSRGNLIAVANFLQVTPARILHGDESGGERTDDAPAGPLLEGIEDAPERRLIGGSSGEVAPGTFAARLGLELERFRVSPAEVARAIGVRDDRVRSWLQDSLLPAEEELAALETWLRLPAGSLMPGGADEEDSSPVSAAPVIRAMPMLLADVNAPEADPQAVADRLMKLLAVNGQTSGDLVRCLQFSPATVRRWVTGEKVPWAANIRILARFFDVEPTWITGGGDEAADPRPSPSAMAAAARLTAGTSSGSDLLGMERADTPEKQAAVLAFGKRLDHAMRAAGLTDRQAAKKLGVSPETVGHLRNGRGVPSLRHLAELAQLVNLTPDELWHGTGKDAPARWTPWTDTLGEVDPVPVFRVVLRRLIAGSGLSLGEIALSLGLEGVDVVKGWLSGRGLPDRDMLAAISNLLETDPSVLEKALEQQTVGYGTVVTFADRFIALVEAEGISYTELARRLEIPPQTLAEWRRGKSVPRRWKLETLAEYFGVTPEHLIEGEPCWRRRPF